MTATVPTSAPAVAAPLSVAVDAGPLHGHRTGVGAAVAATLDALSSRPDVAVVPYVTSLRAWVSSPERKLPLPAFAAHRIWSLPIPHRLAPIVQMDRHVGRPDVLHGLNYVVPPTACPRVVTVHDCWFLEHPDAASPAVRRAGRVLHRAVADGAHVVAVSETTAQRARELLRTDRVTTVLNGPPPPPPAAAAGRPARFELIGDHPFILALGTIERRKNLTTLVAAFRRLANEHRDVRLVVAGADGDDRELLDRAIGLLQADTRRRVLLVGRADPVEKDWLLRNARALAYPSLDEGFGFPILEAQQVGTPVVASAAGAIPEIAGTSALFSAPRDSEALAANLFWVLTNDKQHATLAHRGVANLRRFSWDRAAGQLVELYRALA